MSWSAGGGLPPMTDVEFKAARESLGGTIEWIASRLGVADRTVRRWESGAAPISPGVAADVRDLQVEADDFVAAVVRALHDAGPDEQGGSQVTAYSSEAVYADLNPESPQTARWHRAAMCRVQRELPGVRLVRVGESDD